MKIRNLKYILGMLSLSTTLALTGCGSVHHVENLETSLESLDEGEMLDEGFNELLCASSETSNLTTEEVEEEKEKVVLDSQQINDLTSEINSELASKVEFSSYCDLDHISIFVYSSSKTGESLNLSDEFYSKLNLLLSQDCFYSLSLYEMGLEIDFSKLDLSNINELHLSSCKEAFNYDSFTKTFYDVLTLVDVPCEKAKDFVTCCASDKLELEFSNYNEQNNDNLEFVRFLVDNDVCIDKYSGIDIKNNEDEIFGLVSCLNAREVKILEINQEDVPILNLSLNLNDRIEKFSIFDYHYRELGNIEIMSNNPDFCLELKYAKVMGDTKFSLPDNSSLEMSGVYKSIDAFYNLYNVSELSYYDCDRDVLIYGYKDIFYETINEIKGLHGTTLIKK